jgi:hypothetical protein
MSQNRLRTKMFQVWLHPREYEFLASYAEDNMLTASEVVRGWIHATMEKEGYEVKEPSYPKTKPRRSK